MPASPTLLPRSCAGLVMWRRPSDIDRGQRLLHDRGDRRPVARPGRAPASPRARRRRRSRPALPPAAAAAPRIRGHLDVHVQPGALEVALGERAVDADVVRVREPVEHQRGRLSAPWRADRLLLLRRTRRARARRSTAASGDRARRFIASSPRRSVGPRHAPGARPAVNSANSAIANSDRITTAAYARGVRIWAIDCWKR